MNDNVAKRKLFYTLKDSDERQQFTIYIGQPYLVKQDNVSFKVTKGTAACTVSIVGLPQVLHH